MPGTVTVAAPTAPPIIHVRRDEDVPDDFWLSALGRWGATGRRPNVELFVPREVFLANLAWLPDSCRTYQVGIDWDPLARELVAAMVAERAHLDAIVAAAPEPDWEAAESALRDGRFAHEELRPFQRRDIARLLSLPHGGNFSVPGAGKTAVELAVYEAEVVQNRVQQLLVVAPISAFDAWIDETERWFRDPPGVAVYVGGDPGTSEILVVNYQRLMLVYAELALWVSSSPTLVVLDEAHRMKRGWAGQWGRACLQLAHLAARRDALTGTPAPNSLRDLEAILDFCWPGQARRILPPAALDRDPLPEVVRAAGDAIRPLFVRTTKRELDLPPVNFDVRVVPLEGLQSEIYGALRDRYAGLFAATHEEQLSLNQMGRVVMYLLEAASNPALLPVGSSPHDQREFVHPPLDVPPHSRLAELIGDYGRYETPAKFVQLAQLVNANAQAGRKTLVWSNFVNNLEWLAGHVLAGVNPAVIHGGVPLEAGGRPSRGAELDRFRFDERCHVLLANPAALGEGVSLHRECHHAIYLDRTFNAGQYLQSLDRIHRLGLPQDCTTTITILQTAGTVDEVVDDRVRRKVVRLGAVLDDPHLGLVALPTDEDYGPPLEPGDDLVALFAHLRGDDPAAV